MLFKKLYINWFLASVLFLSGCTGQIQGSTSMGISHSGSNTQTVYEASFDKFLSGENSANAEFTSSSENIASNQDVYVEKTIPANPISPNEIGKNTIGTAEKPEEKPAEPEISQEIEEEVLEKKEKEPVNPADVNAYEVGQIMIIMYHHIVDRPSKTNLERSAADFWDDLQKLYDNGYRLVNISDLINNKINVEAGFSPVVITFDDGWSTAFSLMQTPEGLVPATNCAVDIINRFCAENPDFGMGACFYINAYSDPFKGAGTVEERFTYLIEAGYELGNHTYSHANLSTLGAEGIQKEIMNLELFVNSIKPDYEMLSFCYPYGGRPSTSNRNLVLSGNYAGNSYEYAWALREGPTNNSAAPNNVKFDPTNVPRVRGTDNAAYDLGWYINFYRDNPGIIYISDGNPDTISLPENKAKEVKMESLGEKTLILY